LICQDDTSQKKSIFNFRFWESEPAVDVVKSELLRCYWNRVKLLGTFSVKIKSGRTGCVSGMLFIHLHPIFHYHHGRKKSHRFGAVAQYAFD